MITDYLEARGTIERLVELLGHSIDFRRDTDGSRRFAKESAEFLKALQGSRWTCDYCRRLAEEGQIGPSHDGSRYCESGSIRSGGNRSHCACGTCF
jgi:hypothetical protein